MIDNRERKTLQKALDEETKAYRETMGNACEERKSLEKSNYWADIAKKHWDNMERIFKEIQSIETVTQM
jgi:hypothetical protein